MKRLYNGLLNFTKRNEFIAVVLCASIIITLIITSSVFLTGRNFDSLQASIAPTAIISFGMMIMLICGYFDLSVGSTMLLAGVLSGRFALIGLPLPVIIILVLLAGLVMGCINGFLVAVLKINALIATIGTQYIGYGFAMTLWDKVRQLGKFSNDFIFLGEGKFLGIYIMTWVMLILLVVFSYFFKFTSSGRRLYFVGGNRAASKLMGFNDTAILFKAYAITGMLASLAGILAVARIQSPSQYMGEGIHMTCMIACIVGGGSFAGGKGSAVGAVLGVTFMSLLTNMFNLLEMKTQLQNVVVGLILVAVIVMDGYLNLKKMRALGKI